MKQLMANARRFVTESEGATQVEQLVLIVCVAIGFAAAAVPLGSLLLGYHEGIELVLSLPIP